MSRHFSLSLILWGLLFSQVTTACGYDFVGGCSTDLTLKINGTNSIFAIADCVSEVPFDGLDLGKLRTLSLTQARGVTWESCINNVTAMQMLYRLYETGQTPGSFTTLDLPPDYTILQGPYTTRYRKAVLNQSLTTGLTVGKKYTLEVYYAAEVDTIGDDFIPETFIWQHNGGKNYKLTFEYGGSAAPQLLPVIIRKDPELCSGNSTGVAAIRVFGIDSSGWLFYQWSAFTQNFFQISDLPAGNYSVTVTETPTGNTASITIPITEPPPLAIQVVQATGINCSGAAGGAVVAASGGTAPYTYLWNNGQHTDTLNTSVTGTFTVTVTDAHYCTATQVVSITNDAIATVSNNAVICAGTTFHYGGQIFTQEGNYNFYGTGGGNGCDTLFSLSLSVLDPASTMVHLPIDTAVTCAQPMALFCGSNDGNSSFEWRKNDQLVSISGCLSIISSGIYALTTTQTAGALSCSATRTIQVIEHLTPTSVTADGIASFLKPCVAGDSLSVHAKSHATGPIALYQWRYNDQIISTLDSCVADLPASAAIVGFPNGFTLTVTNPFGCTFVTNPVLEVQQTNNFPFVQQVTERTECNGLVNIEAQVIGGIPPYQYTWSNPDLHDNPVDAAPGLYFMTVSDAQGCQTEIALVVEDFAIETGHLDATGVDQADGTAYVNVNSTANLPYFITWSNGSQGGQATDLLPGIYCVTVTDGTGCTRTACEEIAYTVDAAQPFEAAPRLKVVPNITEAGSWVHIFLPENIRTETVRWQMIDYQGKLIDNQLINSNTGSVQLPDFIPTGWYQIIVNTNQIMLTGKIFLMK